MKRKNKRENKTIYKEVKKEDKILNLKEISISSPHSSSSSSCTCSTSFIIDNTTEHGYCEDPRFQGTIKILKIEKIRKNVYLLKIKTKFEEDGIY